MRQSILMLMATILMVTFSGCKEEVTLSYSGDIMIDLGSTDKDVLNYVSASDGSTVSVTEIDYDLVGEQTATFTTGDVSESKSVKIKADKLAGIYEISVFLLDGNNEYEITVGEGWLMTLTKGNNYNQINIPDSLEKTGLNIFINQGKLVVTFNGKDSAYIPGYTGEFLFTLVKDADYSFSNITYGPIGNGEYAITGFLLKETTDYEHYYRVQLDKKE